jgi:hypothetical protein
MYMNQNLDERHQENIKFLLQNWDKVSPDDKELLYDIEPFSSMGT